MLTDGHRPHGFGLDSNTGIPGMRQNTNLSSTTTQRVASMKYKIIQNIMQSLHYILKLMNNSWVCHSIRRVNWHHVSELEIPSECGAEDLNCFSPLLGREKIIQFLALEIWFHTSEFYTIVLFIHAHVTNTLTTCANTLIGFEESLKGLQLKVDQVFKCE